MAYQPVKQDIKEVELGECSDTDVEGGNASEHASLFSREGDTNNNNSHNNTNNVSLYKRALQANVPVVVSLHLLVLNAVLALALGSLLFKSSAQSHEDGGGKAGAGFAPGELLYTIGQDIIEHRIERAYVGPGYSQGYIPSAYQGWPTDEKDALWKKYEDGNHIRLTKEEASHLLQPTEHVPLAEHKDDYMVGLVVFHHLHCLSAIRRAFYPKRYGTSMLDADGNVNYASWHHIDHCIEILRTYLECHPETTAMPLQWVPQSTLAVYPVTQHTCRNFDVLSEWVYERSVDVPIRSHVEAGGRVVDYTGRPYGDEYNETWVMEVPKGWAHTIDDM